MISDTVQHPVTRAARAGGQLSVVALVGAIFLLPGAVSPSIDWFAVLAVAAFVCAVIAGIRRPLLISTWPYLLYLGAVVASALVSPSEQATSEVRRQVLFVAVVFAVPRLFRTPRSMGVVLAAIVAGAAVVLFQAVAESLQSSGVRRLAVYEAVRQWSGYPELGMIACLGAAAALAAAAVGRERAFRAASGCLAAFFSVAAILLYSRLAWVTIALVNLWLAAVSFVRWKRAALVVLLVALGAVFAAAIWYSPLVSRFADSLVEVRGSRQLTTRAHSWSAAKAMISDRPWLGVGPGNYPSAYPRYSSHRDPSHAHNALLHVGAELGAFGMMAFLIMWGRALATTFAAAGPGAIGTIAFAVHALLIAFFVRSMGDYFLGDLAASFRFVFLLAVVFGLAEAVRDGERQ
jgi:putative inorganic carbon (HCO3(-)) transporter